MQDGYAWIFREPRYNEVMRFCHTPSLGSSPLGRRAAQDAHRSAIPVVRPAVAAKPKLRQ